MTTAKITRRPNYKCAPRGAIVETFPFGEVVTGKVAAWALADGAASRMFDPREETKVEAPEETKAEAIGVEIPEDWRDLSWPKLRSLAASVSDNPIRNRDDAIAAIEAAE